MAATERTPATRTPCHRWQVGIAALLAVTVASGGTSLSFGISDGTLGHLRLPRLQHLSEGKREAAPLQAKSLTEAMRRRGYNECMPYDFDGLGPYAPYRRLTVGRIAVPQRGGHTPDGGYDVVVHFHGQAALRTTLVQVAKGVAFVGIDLGNGSGPYSDNFAARDAWPRLRESIESALRAESGIGGAHIRHLGLLAWSAGYGAVNEILKYHAAEVDAVVLLDGLHAAWDPRFEHGYGPHKVVAGPIEPTVEYARQALAGDKIFVFTHSEVDPVLYPSTRDTAKFLINELGLSMKQAPPTSDPFGLLGAVDIQGFHVWSYRGNDKPAHCTHLSHVDRAVRDILEPAWDTPAMDRSVEPTPAPRLGTGTPVVASSNGEHAESHAQLRATQSASGNSAG